MRQRVRRLVARLLLTMAMICEAFTVSVSSLKSVGRPRGRAQQLSKVFSLFLQCCCRWFSRRREEEEKEGLLTGDPQQCDAEVLQQQPSVNHQLRERARVDQDPRRVARVGFQSRLQVRK